MVTVADTPAWLSCRCSALRCHKPTARLHCTSAGKQMIGRLREAHNAKGDETMSSTYVRRFNLKSSLSDKQVNDFWKLLMGEFVPAIHWITHFSVTEHLVAGQEFCVVS